MKKRRMYEEYEEMRAEVEELKQQLADLQADKNSFVTEHAVKQAAENLVHALRTGNELRAIAIVRETKENFGGEWEGIMNLKDVGGVSVAHLCARECFVEVVRELQCPAFSTLCNTPTYATRTPGLWTPLHCLADQDHQHYEWKDLKEMVELLMDWTYLDALAQQNSKGNTFLHLAASRGNLYFMTCALEAMYQYFPEEDITYVLNMENLQGKSVADLAVYNKQIKDLVYSWGGEHKKAPPPDWNERGLWLSENHRWNRIYKRRNPQ